MGDPVPQAASGRFASPPLPSPPPLPRREMAWVPPEAGTQRRLVSEDSWNPHDEATGPKVAVWPPDEQQHHGPGSAPGALQPLQQ